MKIAIVTVGELPVPSIKGGGAETLIEQILEQNEKNKKLNIKVYSIKNEMAEKKSKEFQYTQFKFLSPVKNPIFNRLKRKFIKKLSGFDIPIERFSYRSIIKDIKKEKFDLIIIENTMVPFYKYTKIFGDKVVIHNHWDYINNEIPEIVLKKYRQAALKSGGIITVSEYIKKRVMTVPEIDGEKIYVLKNCTDLERFQIPLSEQQKISLREKYGLDKDEVVLIFSGRISKEKGVIQLVKAFKALDNREKARLVIVGNAQTSGNIVDAYTQEVYDEIEQIKDRVVFTGYVEYENMPLLYHMADIAVLPSTGQDPAPLTIFEAMASGLPIITTYSGGIPEYANEGCALFSEIDNNIVDSLKYNMKELIGNNDKRKEMGRKSYETSNNFSTEQYYKDFVKIVRNIYSKVND